MMIIMTENEKEKRFGYVSFSSFIRFGNKGITYTTGFETPHKLYTF